MPAYGKALERMVEKDLAADGEEPKAQEEYPFEQSDDDDVPF